MAYFRRRYRRRWRGRFKRGRMGRARTYRRNFRRTRYARRGYRRRFARRRTFGARRSVIPRYVPRNSSYTFYASSYIKCAESTNTVQAMVIPIRLNRVPDRLTANEFLTNITSYAGYDASYLATYFSNIVSGATTEYDSWARDMVQYWTNMVVTKQTIKVAIMQNPGATSYTEAETSFWIGMKAGTQNQNGALTNIGLPWRGFKALTGVTNSNLTNVPAGTMKHGRISWQHTYFPHRIVGDTYSEYVSDEENFQPCNWSGYPTISDANAPFCTIIFSTLAKETGINAKIPPVVICIRQAITVKLLERKNNLE